MRSSPLRFGLLSPQFAPSTPRTRRGLSQSSKRKSRNGPLASLSGKLISLKRLIGNATPWRRLELTAPDGLVISRGPRWLMYGRRLASPQAEGGVSLQERVPSDLGPNQFYEALLTRAFDRMPVSERAAARAL